MKLTKKQETEVWQVYNKWLDAYLNGDIKTYNKYLDKEYHFIGSTNNEEFLSKKDTTQFFKDTADQLAGKCNLRNEIKIIEKFEGLVFVTHLFDAWFKNGDDYAYYGRFRFTNTLKENKQGWRFIYQHFSTTDSKTDEGETIGFDKVNKENQELREAIQRRTIELELKNRELEVETALERIRAQAVAMKQSTDLLDIVVTMRNEFIKLGHEAHYFWHMMWLPKTYEKAMTSGDGSKIGFVMQLPRHIHGDIPQLAKWEKSKKPTVVYTMNVDEAIDYVDKMVALGDFKNIDPQAPTHDDIRHIGGLTFIMARTTHGEIGYSLPGIVENPPKEDVNILVKFAGAFDLAHQRFLDLQKAEEQARETQIELSLERIRSRVTAMQESSDLFDIVVTMRNEFLSLGHKADYFWHMKWAKDNYEMSMTAEDGSRLGMIITVPKFVHEQIENLHQWEKSESPYFVLALKGKEAWDYIEKMNIYGKYKLVDPHAPSEEDILHIGGLTFIIARTTHGEIGFSLSGKVDNPPEASIDILVRFASVFDLAYKRFEDLKKAEARARETQIELALEKVRSRTMAMQHSDELQEASFLLDQQVRELGIKTWGCAFNIYGEKESTEWFGNEAGVLHTYKVPREGIFKDYYDKGQKGESLFIQEFSGDDCVAHYEYMSSLPVIGDVLKTLKETNNGFPTYQIDHIVYFKYGYLLFITRETVPDAHDIFKRFAKVFEQTYTRFLDLQKAEAQAREAQIEAALERVRSRSMAMHNSEELKEVIQVLYNEFVQLGIPIEHAGFIMDYTENDDMHIWLADEHAVFPEIRLPYFDCAHWNSFNKAKKAGKNFFANQLGFEEKNKFYKDLFQFIPDLPEETKETYYKFDGLAISTVLLDNVGLYIENYSGTPFTDGENKILMRFGKVFQQTYTRFLDLKKAEAQAKEAKVEAALERVRSQSMGMQTSQDLSSVTTEMFKQLRQLGGDLFATGIVFCDKHEGHVEQWHSLPKAGMMSPFIVPIDLDYIHQYRYDEWKKGTELFSVEIPSDFIEQHFQDIFNLPSAQKVLKDFEDQNTPMPEAPPWEIDYGASFKHGYILVSSLEHFKEAQVLPRFAKVFEQAYTRFLDLQKAEAQAREAQIEAALEKVRSRTMAMQHSKELPEAANVLFTEVQNLGIPAWSCGYNILSKDKKSSTCIMSSEGEIQSPFVLPLTEHKSLKPWHKAILNNEEFFLNEQGGKDLVEHYDYMQSLPDLKETFKQLKAAKIPLPTFQVNHLAKFTNGFLLFITYKRVPEAHNIFHRFAKVFEQTYTRFLDLQKAEAQAREAQINLAVERVRAKALAMHKSEDILGVVAKLKDEVMALDIPDVIAATIFLREDEEKVRMWDLSSLEENNNGYQIPFDITFKIKKRDPNLYIKRIWENPRDYFIEIQNKKDFKRIIEWLREHDETQFADEVETFIETTKLDQLYHAIKKLANGKLVIDLLNPPTNEMETILTKMGAAFDLAYKRFEDLQKAEAQAREAQIETALERVRSRTLAMQNSEELAQTSVVVFQQLLELGIAPNRLFIGIIKDNGELLEAWATNEDGSKIETQFTLHNSKNKSIKKMIDGWKQHKKSLVIDMKGKELQDYFQYLNKDMDIPFIHGLNQKRRVQTIAYFSGGLIGMAAPEEQPQDTINLLERFAAVFNLTYTRFNDLKIAEAQTKKAEEDLIKLQAAKKNAEDALSELQLTQNQLIQSEKMASLGELTAGIAHEIQNPLNFVNNFSEVSKELLDEMLEEIESGDMEEVKAIMDDVIQNLEKINHHGKRADGIVKGMLQHSRASGNQKEPTNINALADEYLRLAYHGLRAKDKSFNATLVTDFDDNLENINVIPQDIGRVVLNLLTNAFYVVNEKKQSNLNGFVPTVKLSTKKDGNWVTISVKDNGNGIPQKVLDKIFQPFFTTKPTGQGTGLGLSMSYDIVTKGHGGELQVKTEEGKGTIFIIKLPI